MRAPVDAWGAAARLPLLAAVCYRLVLVWSASERELSTLTPDDAYCYFGIARSLAGGAGSSFDGVTPTNGYQPLWLLVCAALAKLSAVTLDDPTSWARLPRIAIATQMLCGLAATTVVARSVRSQRESPAAERWVWLLACNPLTVYSMCDGTEAGLVMLLTASVVALIARAPAQLSPRSSVELGALLALAALARLDLALLTPLCALRLGGTWRERAWLLGLPCVVLAIYAAINFASFDTIIPISAWIKDSFPALSGRRLDWLSSYFPQALTMGFIVYSALRARTRLPRSGATRALELGALYVLLHWAHTLLFMRGDVWKWHFASYWPIALFACGSWVGSSARRWELQCFALAALFICSAQVASEWRYLDGRSHRAFMGALYDLAQRTRKIIPSHALIAMSDAAVFGYYRGGGVLVLDGLVLDRDYQRRLQTEGLQAYLAERKVGYLAARFEADPPAPGYAAYAYKQDSMLTRTVVGGAFELAEQREQLRMEFHNPHGQLQRTIVLWQLDQPP